MIVVDTNILCYYILPSGPFTGSAEEIWRKDPDWNAPLLWRSEFRNVLSDRIRAGDMSLPEGFQSAARAESILEGKDFPVSTEEVLRLAARSGCTAYDCEFVALAERLAVPLVTMDRQILRAFPDVALSPRRFLAGK